MSMLHTNEHSNAEDLLQGSIVDVNALSKEFFSTLMQATKHSNAIASQTNDIQFYKASCPELKAKIKGISKQITENTQKMIDSSDSNNKPNISNMADVDDVVDSFEDIVEMVDVKLESVDMYIDAQKEVTSKLQIDTSFAIKNTHMIVGSNIVRPQLQFNDIDNSRSCFVPKITNKVNSKKPLDESIIRANELGKTAVINSLDPEMEKHIKNMRMEIEAPVHGYPHPYYYEIEHFSYTEEQLAPPAQEQLYAPLESTPLTMVKTADELALVVDKLATQKEIAVDLEQHGYRSFQGFVCLMQISTRTEDFLIDTLTLRSHMHILNEIFTNDKIVKVLHGANYDILWLQRDFGIYVVNMFDTGQASRVLNFGKYSLAYLLEHFCKIKADKQYQVADWRIRPLPKEMIHYARQDTHYLLYIYDRLRNMLISQGNVSNNLLTVVLNRSREICKFRYEKPLITEDSHKILYNKFQFVFSKIQMRVFKALYDWRDLVAREEDESTRYILPDHMLFKIADLMPEERGQLMQCCGQAVPPAVKSLAPDLLLLILHSKSDVPSAPSNTSSPVPKRTAKVASFLQEHNGGDKSSLKSISAEEEARALSPSTQELYAKAGWELKPDAEMTEQMIEKTLDTPSRLGNEFIIAPSPYAISFDEINSGFDASKPLENSLFKDPVSDSINDEKMLHLIQSSLPEKFNNIGSMGANFEAKNKQLLTAEDGYNSDEVNDKQPSENLVPQSMEEIYILSNKNRKRNKEKKKLKEESINRVAFSPIKFSEDISSDEGEKKKKKKKSSLSAPPSTIEEAKAFMSNIGWPAGAGGAQAEEATFNNSSNNNNNSNSSKVQQLKGHRRSKSKDERQSRKKKHKPQNNSAVASSSSSNSNTNYAKDAKSFPPHPAKAQAATFVNYDYSSQPAPSFGSGNSSGRSRGRGHRRRGSRGGRGHSSRGRNQRRGGW